MTVSRNQVMVFTVAAFIALLGLGEATYLAVQYLTGETAICGGSSDCFKVLGSSYARPAGIPLAVVGALAYFAAFSFATLAAFGFKHAQRFFAITAFSMFTVTLYLLFVQAFILHAFCRYCLFSAAMIFLLTGAATLAPPARFPSND
jgi:uncharacterized membrane protein